MRNISAPILFLIVLIFIGGQRENNIFANDSQPESIELNKNAIINAPDIRTIQKQKELLKNSNIVLSGIRVLDIVIPEEYFWRVFMLSEIILIVTLFFIWNRKKRQIYKENKKVLKHNIILLREEKLKPQFDSELEKVRTNLILQPITNDIDKDRIIEYAKKYNLSKGELLLASKIKIMKK